jgi:hypothetical protein
MLPIRYCAFFSELEVISDIASMGSRAKETEC